MQIIEFRTKTKNGIIQIPAEFMGKVAGDVHLILIAQSDSNWTIRPALFVMFPRIF